MKDTPLRIVLPTNSVESWRKSAEENLVPGPEVFTLSPRLRNIAMEHVLRCSRLKATLASILRYSLNLLLPRTPDKNSILDIFGIVEQIRQKIYSKSLDRFLRRQDLMRKM